MSCQHDRTRYGRCVACGMTLEAQAHEPPMLKVRATTLTIVGEDFPGVGAVARALAVMGA